MGQAKQRGTFEQRKAKAILMDEAERSRLHKLEAERLASMTDEEKKAEFEYKQIICKYMGFAMSGLNSGYFPYKI